LEPSLVLSIASIVISGIAVVIAWRSPRKSEEIKSTKRARQIHFDKIKQNCLEPLVIGINNVENQFHIDESTRYNKQSVLDLKNDRELNEVLDVKLYVSITNHAYGSYTLDTVLYNDLNNHYPELKKQIETVQKFLDDNYPSYNKKQTELVLRLFDKLEKPINAQENEQNKISMAVTTALLCIFKDDKKYWPNLYNVASKNGTLPTIKEIINQSEITELGNPLKEISAKSRSLLSDLRNSVNQIIRYEGELQGKCNYLQV
jgi:hypothetical protein